MLVVGYITKTKEEPDSILEKQEQRIIDYADAMGYNIYDIYREEEATYPLITPVLFWLSNNLIRVL